MHRSVIINFIGFQVAWFACVIGAAKGHPWLGVGVTFIILIWHFFIANQAKQEIKLLLIALLIGATFDQAMLSYGLINYQQHGWSINNSVNTIVPVWILALWLGFATSLNVSLRWMRGKTMIACLFGLVGGPLAYIAAEKLGAVVLAGNQTYLALGFGWAVIVPLLLNISSRFDGFKETA